MDIVSLFADANVRDIGATALLTIVVLMILTGRLRPKSAVDEWRDAYLKERAAGDVMRQQISELVSTGRVTARVLDSLPTAGGEPNVLEEATETPRRRRQG